MSTDAWLDPPPPTAIDPGLGLTLLLRGAFVGPRSAVPRALKVGARSLPLRAWLPVRTYCPGRFWALVDIPAGTAANLDVALELDSGTRLDAGELAFGRARGQRRASVPGAARVTVCLATHEPDPVLLERQIASLHAQTMSDWITILCDDASGPKGRACIDAAVAGDPRFHAFWHEERVGSYRNFERAAALAPRETEAIAYCDQDDVWAPDKLERLLSALPSRGLACGDARVTDPAGRVLSPTFWTTRRDLPEDLRSVLIANSVPGCTMLWDASLRETVLPFPPQLEHLHHDGWAAANAVAAGGLRRLADPVVDYVQHPANVLGHFAAVNPRIARLGRRETVAVLVRSGARRRVAETQIDAALRPEALARTIWLRRRATGAPPGAALAAAAEPDDSTARIAVHLGRTVRAGIRHGLPGTELSVARGHTAIRLAGSRGRGLISG